MEALVLGCGEAFDEDLFNTSVLLRTGSAVMLFDCGYSIPPRFWSAVSDPDALDLVYISHAHADHYFGLAAVLGRMWEDGRTKPLTLLSQPAVLEQIRAAMELGYRGLSQRFKYPIEFQPAALDETVEACGASFRFAETRHSVTNFAVSVEAEGATFCYSGDGALTPRSAELFADADLLVHEAYSFDESPVHADIPGVLDLAQSSDIQQVALVHVQRAVRRVPDRILKAVAKVENAAALLPEPGDCLTF